MTKLKVAIEYLDEVKYSEILLNEIFDSDECLMLIYAAVVCFNSEKAFDIILRRNNNFRLKPEWHTLFSSPRIYSCLAYQLTSPERRKLDLLTLKSAFDKDLYFMADVVLDRSRITKQLIQVILGENQKKLLVSMVSKSPRALYIDTD